MQPEVFQLVCGTMGMPRKVIVKGATICLRPRPCTQNDSDHISFQACKCRSLIHTPSTRLNPIQSQLRTNWIPTAKVRAHADAHPKITQHIRTANDFSGGFEAVKVWHWSPSHSSKDNFISRFMSIAWNLSIMYSSEYPCAREHHPRMLTCVNTSASVSVRVGVSVNARISESVSVSVRVSIHVRVRARVCTCG